MRLVKNEVDLQKRLKDERWAAKAKWYLSAKVSAPLEACKQPLPSICITNSDGERVFAIDFVSQHKSSNVGVDFGASKSLIFQGSPFFTFIQCNLRS